MEMDMKENAIIIVDWIPLGFNFFKRLKYLYFTLSVLRPVL